MTTKVNYSGLYYTIAASNKILLLTVTKKPCNIYKKVVKADRIGIIFKIIYHSSFGRKSLLNLVKCTALVEQLRSVVILSGLPVLNYF